MNNLVNEILEIWGETVGLDPYLKSGLCNGVEMTIGEVIEKWKNDHGMDRFHVSIGPEATPQSLYDSLVAIEKQQYGYDVFPEVERLKAHIAFLETKLDKVRKLGQASVNVWIEMPVEESKLRNQCFHIGGMYSIVDLGWETAYMKAREEGLSDHQSKQKANENA